MNSVDADLKKGADLSVPEFEAFWQDVVPRLRPPLERFFSRKYPAVAQDLAQETFIKVCTSFKPERWQHLPPKEKVRVCANYLWHAARTVAADHYRKIVASTTDRGGNEGLEEIRRQIQQRITEGEFKKVMDSWSVKTRQIVSLRLAEEMSWPKIAEELGLQKKQAGTAKMQFHRAMKKLGL